MGEEAIQVVRSALLEALLIAAPILGLAFVVFLPVIGIGAVIWVLAELVWRRLRPTNT